MNDLEVLMEDEHMVSLLEKFSFDPTWLKLGVIDYNIILHILDEYNKSEDKNIEHYRWKAFLKFNEQNQNISPEHLLLIYNAVQNDSDVSLVASLTHILLDRKDVSEEIVRSAINSSNASVRRKSLKILESLR